MKSLHKTNVLFEKSRFMSYNGIGNKKLKQNQITPLQARLEMGVIHYVYKRSNGTVY